ncbi:MAG: hypothetical protein KJ666_08950 [Bacteroidetes bacterium]|nr:hypothetical protein [Bacteroidota bacterium]MBU2586269.1 hypothetical protein [Bacteroidota bacterium]
MLQFFRFYWNYVKTLFRFSKRSKNFKLDLYITEITRGGPESKNSHSESAIGG